MRPDRLPAPLRAAVFAAAVAVVLYVCLAPTEDLPAVGLWDKAEHVLTWGGLTALGLVLAPGRWRAVAGFCLFLGLLVEILQAYMGLGRMGDWRDLVADAVGVLLAIRITQLVRRIARPRAATPEANP